MPPNLQSSEPLDKSNEAQGGAAELDSAQLAELEKIRQLDAMFEKEFQWRPRSLFTILRRIFFFEDKSSWKYPLSERLNTETAERKIDSSPLRRLEVAPGFLDSYEVNSRHNFHVVKDGQSAYVILKTKEFILDAMGRLERRGQRFYYVAVAAFAAAITMMTLGLIYAYHNLTNSVPLAPKVQDAFLMNEVPYQFALRILGVLGASGLLLIVVKMLLAVAKASMHEAVKNFERRHAMRFGWLYMELMGSSWKFEELKEAFQWNREATSAFRDIDLRHVADTTLNALLARLNELSSDVGTKAVEKAVENSVGGHT